MTTRQLNILGLSSRTAAQTRPQRSDLAALAAQPDNELLTGITIIGRAAMHAWRSGDMTDEEAADFVEDVIDPLIANSAERVPDHCQAQVTP